jgi:iron complex outermembrane receptor protein/vitamin B12 transporter
MVSQPAKWLVGSSLLCAALLARAQDSPLPLETLVVTGTRVSDRAIRSASVTVLDAEVIGARNDANVLDLLADVPGVHVNRAGGRGSVSEVLLRGGEPNFTTVLIDGVQVNDPTNTRGGSFDFSGLNLDDIERVEILRGPLSAVHGSDALSGVINVITHEGTERLETSVDAALGSEEYLRGGLRVGGPARGEGRFAVRAGMERDGESGGPQTFRGHSLGGKFTGHAGDATRMTLYARYGAAESRAFPDSSGGPRFAVLREQDHRESEDGSLRFALRSAVSTRTDLHLAASVFEHGERVASPGVAAGILPGIPASHSDTDFSRRDLRVYLSSAWNSRVSTAVGLDYRREEGTSVGRIRLAPEAELPTNYSLSRHDVSAYGEVAYTADSGLHVIAGLRADETEAAGRETTGRLALAYRPRSRPLGFRVGWAQGFKLPSLFALGDPLVGNPGLRSETVEGWELGLDGSFWGAALAWELTAFRQQFSDLIDFDFDRFTSVNRSRVETDGAELGGRYTPSERWELSAHATYTDIDVLDSTATLQQRPERRGGISALWTPSRAVSIHIGWQYVGERVDSSIPTGERTLPSYERLDVNAMWRMDSGWRLSLAVDNIRDDDYEEAIGFPNAGRRLRISVSGAFGGRDGHTTPLPAP